jgi:very-short-patch-repair endonuclease
MPGKAMIYKGAYKRKPTNKIPRELSPGEEAFVLHCRVENLEPIREYAFHPKRKWRFDFYFAEKKLAVEVEGGYAGRHQRGGFQKDMEKYNAAGRMGILVLRYTTRDVMRGDAIAQVLGVLRGEEDF